MVHNYTYDTRNRLTNLGVSGTVNGAPGAIASYAYTLDAAGHRTSVTELSGRTVSYGYDSIYRLTSETIASDPSNVNGAASYVYDPVGNRTQKTSTIPGYPGGLTNYNANDQLATDTYDADGNTTASNGVGYVYDFENRLVQAGGGISIVYDGDGNRVSKTVAGMTTTYVVDTQNPTGYAQVLYESTPFSTANREVSHSFVYGLSEGPVYEQRQYLSGGNFFNQTMYFVYDGHGSVRALTDPTGTVTDTYDYDAFGNLLHSSTTLSSPSYNNYLFAGEQFDPDLNLYYNRARYLNTSTGRFWSMDTNEGSDGSPLSLHKYLYTSADPTNFTDPSGRGQEDEILVAESEKEAIQVRVTVEILPQGSEAISLATRVFQVLSAIAILATAVSLEGDNPPNPGPADGKDRNQEIFYRFGFKYEDATSLELQSQQALPVVGFHGVSVMTRAKYPAPFATRAEIESRFRLEKTTANPYHYTVVLPTPVTDGDALAFNKIFKRKIPQGLF